MKIVLLYFHYGEYLALYIEENYELSVMFRYRAMYTVFPLLGHSLDCINESNLRV